MTSQQDQAECDVNIHFVLLDHQESENDCSEEMWLAFNKCLELGLQPNWVAEKICEKMKPSKNDVFIIEEFKGHLFEKLKQFKCSRVVSPKCVLICYINGEPIPEGNSPIYTTAMRGMCICVSGLNVQAKQWLQQRIEYMGGFFMKQLRSCVTHLVADSVMSAKYEGAANMKIPIMRKEWIEAVWEANLKEMIKADDKTFDKYKCSVFMNLIVTSTNLPKRQKEEIKQLIHDHGGTFMGPLDGTKVRVVVASENGPVSDKLRYAMDNGIACLKPNWVYESIKVGYALPFSNFVIKSGKACSTPEKTSTRPTLSCGDISSIAFDKPQNNFINESLLSTMSNFSAMDAGTSNLCGTATLNVLDRLTFSEAKSAGSFLDGCNIYLAGFVSNIRDRLNRILNVGGATRLDEISDAVTHVIVDDENRAAAELKAIKLRGLSPYILSIEWLEESMKLKRPASEERFLFEAKTGASKKNLEAPASPLSKRNLQMLQSKRPPVPPFNLTVTPTNEDEQPENNLIQQYLQETTGRNSTAQEFVKPSTPESVNKGRKNSNDTKDARVSETSLSQTAQMKDSKNESSVPASQSCTVNEKLLKNLTFVVVGFDDEDNNMEETIRTLGGRIVHKTYTGIPDYGVVPIHGTSLKHTVNEIVTDLFIEDCINQEQIVSIMYYHKPLFIKKACSPLSGCVITMSMYTGMERVYLSTLATKLGAICQDMFARKPNAEKSTHGSTHLVCPTPEGNKYNAAVRWKLPAVTADWLKTCADRLALVDETPFLVGETMAPSRSNETNSPNVSEKLVPAEEPSSLNKRNILTPKRHLSQPKDQEIRSLDTPLVNKRLSLVINQTPQSQSPFHISTPDTPYGQVFKSDPSPDTRKGWIKWVDNFPDLQVTEPPLKRRAPSTPLSELKRQLWEKLKEPDQADENQSMLNNDSSSERTEQNEIANHYNKDIHATTEFINRKLNFDDENSPMPSKSNNEITMQIAQLDKVLQRTSSTPENRYSLSGENAKKYEDVEAPDHIQKCVIKDSQQIDAIVWEDPDHPKRLTNISSRQTSTMQKNNNDSTDDDTENDVEKYEHEPSIHNRSKIFMLSGIKDKTAYERVIKGLDGEVSTDMNFDNNATHLLCIRLSRNEKLLSSIASGKWILHCSYLHDSEREGRFLDEEEYEWGNPKSKGKIPEPKGEIEQAIANAIYRWRKNLLRDPNGPFSKMVALLMISEDKYGQFKRLIEAGGGSVIQARPPYDTSPSGRKITHCFVNVKQVSQPIDWAMLASKGILCFLPQYLSDFLTAVTPPNVRDCVLPEFKKYLTLLPK